jgi:glycosyltransferase involved in cell wall biosynthesis
VVDGETGWIVEAVPETLAARLEAALRDRVSALRMGEAGRRRVEALFTRSRRASLVEAVYARILEKEALPRP